VLIAHLRAPIEEALSHMLQVRLSFIVFKLQLCMYLPCNCNDHLKKTNHNLISKP
jgi:hypothetical protein